MSAWLRCRIGTVGLLGFGDVAARLQHMQTSLCPNSRYRLMPRLRPFSRSLGSDLGRRATARRAMAQCSRFIVLAPPVAGPAQHGQTDILARQLSLHSRRLVRPGAPGPVGVYVSTTGVYGDHQGAEVVETSACRPQELRSRLRLSAEGWLRPRGYAVLRAPGIIAEDRLPIQRILEARPALRPEDDVFTSHIHADDLAMACWMALWRGRPARVVNAVDGHPQRMGDYFDMVADAFKLSRVPRIARSELDLAVADGRISPMAASFFKASRRVFSNRLGPELRLALRWPSAQAVVRGAREDGPGQATIKSIKKS